MHLIWFACVWVIWQDINDRIFNIKEKIMTQLLDKVKYMSLWWLKTKTANVYVGYYG